MKTAEYAKDAGERKEKPDSRYFLRPLRPLRFSFLNAKKKDAIARALGTLEL